MTHQGQIRSADWAGDRLINQLERQVTVNQPAKTDVEYKAPTCDDKGEVDYSVLCFTEVSTSNDWGECAILLHFREALKDEAQDWDRPLPCMEYLKLLRTRYGISSR